MTPYRTLLYLIKRKRKCKKLIIPFSFFILESSLILLITLNILGFNIFNLQDRYSSEPMLLVRLVHSQSYFEAHNTELSFFAINQSVSLVDTFANFMSIGVALIGLFISILWMNRFFKINSINIEWWVWPTGCVASHLFFLIILI